MKPAARTIFIVYAVVVILDLLFILLQRDDYRWFSKPLLMPLLMIAFYRSAIESNRKPASLILLALFLSWCGDVLLQAKNLFIPGLLAFLLAHVVYIIYLLQTTKGQKGILQQRPVMSLPVVAYIIVLLLLLFPYLGALKVPVIVYSFTIGTMLLMAINTLYVLHPKASALLIAGALFFVLSDSLLAINLFVLKAATIDPFIMITYAAAQYLISMGALVVSENRSGSSTAIAFE